MAAEDRTNPEEETQQVPDSPSESENPEGQAHPDQPEENKPVDAPNTDETNTPTPEQVEPEPSTDQQAEAPEPPETPQDDPEIEHEPDPEEQTGAESTGEPAHHDPETDDEAQPTGAKDQDDQAPSASEEDQSEQLSDSEAEGSEPDETPQPDPEAEQEPDPEEQIEAETVEEFDPVDSEADGSNDMPTWEDDDADDSEEETEGMAAGRRAFSMGASRGGIIPAPPETDPHERATPFRRLLDSRFPLLFSAALKISLVIVIWACLVRPSDPETPIAVDRSQFPDESPQSPPSQGRWRNRGFDDPAGRREVPAEEDITVPEEHRLVPLSWVEAEKTLLAQRYAQALRKYTAMLEHSKTRPENQVVTDLLNLRVAQCLVNLGRVGGAERFYARVLASDSPVVRAVGHYHLAVRDLVNGQFLRARMRAYLAIVDLAMLEVPLELEADCDFLIACATSKKALACHGKAELVEWSPLQIADPFAALDEAELRSLLVDGCGRTRRAVLGPQVEEVVPEGGGRRFAVKCTRASIEELVVRFCVQADLELKWFSVPPAVRARSVSVYYSQVSEQRLAEVSCGAVGLLAQYTGDEIIVYDPQAYGTLSQEQDLLTREAMAMWRRLFLRLPGDPRLPKGHLAYGILQECDGEITGAMREYQLIAQRFGGNEVAPEALLRSAEMRIRLRDYSGARLDLTNLLDQYPDCISSDRVYLYLGEATMKAGLLDEATRIFAKLFHKNLSEKSRLHACMGAARCFEKMENTAQVKEWITRYIGLVESQDDGLAEAYMMLGKSEVALGNTTEAASAFYYALAANPPQGLHVGIILSLAKVESGEGRFLTAMGVLNRLRGFKLTPAQTAEYILGIAGIYREIGVPEKGALLLRRHVATIFDHDLRAKVVAELARCYVDDGDLEAGGKVLAEFLPRMKAGATAHDAACQLAEICLRLGKVRQAIMLTTSLLQSSDCSPVVRKRAQDTLGSAYVLQQDYDRAALAFSGLMFEQGGPTE